MAAQKLRTIKLYGSLAKRFGRYHQFYVASAQEAIRALCSQIKGFEQQIRSMELIVKVGSDNINESDLRAGILSAPSGNDIIKISPVISGSGKDGTWQTVLGVILVAVGFFTYGSTTKAGMALIAAGAGMAAGGVALLLTPTPKLGGDRDDPNNRASYNFNGPVNTVVQGNCMPVLYGELLIGSQVASAGRENEDLA